MDQYRLYSAEDIEALKEKINLYQQMLHSMKAGSTIDDYLLTKQERSGLKKKIEGVLEKMEEYHYGSEQKMKQLSVQVQSVIETVNGLKSDFNSIKEKVDRLQIHDLMEKMNYVIDAQKTTVNTETNEVDLLKEEITRLKEKMANTNSQQVPREEVYVSEEQPPAHPKTSDYRKLQNMLQTSRQFSPARNDPYPPMSHRSANSQFQHQHPNYQNQPSYTQTSISYPDETKQTPGKKKTYTNPNLDFNKNTVIRSNSKKNDNESAQESKDVENTEERKKLAFETVRKSNSKEQIKAREEENENHLPPLEEATEKESPVLNDVDENEESHTEQPKKMEFSSLFSIFQKRNE